MIGIDGPEVLLGQVSVPSEVGEGAFAADQGTLMARQGGQLVGHVIGDLLEFLLVGVSTGLVVLGMVGVEFAEGLDAVVSVDLDILRAHPGVRVRFAGVFVLGDIHRFDDLGDDDVRNVGGFHELLEPALQTQPVVENEIGLRRLLDVVGCGLVVVDLGAGLGDRLDRQVVAGNVLRNVLQHGEGGEDDGFVVRFRGPDDHGVKGATHGGLLGVVKT